MELSPEIRKAFELLLAQEDFLQHIAAFTCSALQTISNQPQTEELSCPPAYLFVLNHALQTPQTFKTFLMSLPSTSRAEVEPILAGCLGQKQETELDNTILNNLTDIKWQMTIENGREVYEVQLFTSQSETPFKMRLCYEQLSVLTFQVSQIVSTLGHINVK